MELKRTEADTAAELDELKRKSAELIAEATKINELYKKSQRPGDAQTISDTWKGP